MEGEFIVISIITTLGMLASIMLWNHNWFRRLDAKYKYQLKKAKLAKKMKVDIPEEKGKLQTLASIAPLLSKLSPETIEQLADTFLGEPAEGENWGLNDITKIVPPELIKGFLEGIQTPAKKEESVVYER